MKLNQYKEKKNHKKLLIVAVAIIFLIGGVILDRTFANFKVQKSFKVMDGNFIYEGKGDIIFAFYENNKQVNEIANDYDFEKSVCTNDATAIYKGSTKRVTVNNLIKTGTKCDLYFIKNKITEYFENLQKEKPEELIYDKTSDNNLRFIGADPNNYLSFNNDESSWKGYYSNNSDTYRVYNSYNECIRASSFNYKCEKIPSWRIIGIMNNIEDENGATKSYIKIIRESIGEYSWDVSDKSVNNAFGVNEWRKADIQTVLNTNYYKMEDGGTCYHGTNVATCPSWASIGLNEDVRNIVGKVKWHTGTMNVSYNSATNLTTPSYMYEMEKSENTGKICSNSEIYCNDEIDRTASWIGYVGLMYPSDYGFSTSGKEESQRQTCLATAMTDWWDTNNGENQNKCPKNSWLYYSGQSYWTVTSATDFLKACNAFEINNDLAVTNVSSYLLIRPVVYLNGNIKIEEDNSENYGSINNPFRLIS